jgi:hypothetical protein
LGATKNAGLKSYLLNCCAAYHLHFAHGIHEFLGTASKEGLSGPVVWGSSARRDYLDPIVYRKLSAFSA